MPPNQHNTIVGLIPAAGTASRIQPLPCSKELLPAGIQSVDTGQKRTAPRLKPVSQYLLESMACAGAHLVYMVIRRGKWDIPEYYGPGTGTGVDIAYIVTDLPYGAPFSLKQALPFASQSIVLFGFPDIRLKPVNAFLHLLSKMHETRADLVLGLFRATDPSKMDMVRLNRYGDITAIDIKPATSSLTYTWLIAVWSSAFTNFMQSHLDKMEPRLRKQRSTGFIGWEAEYYLGHVILAALKTDIKISHVIFQEGQYIDIGTPEILFETMKYIGSLKGEEDDHC